MSGTVRFGEIAGAWETDAKFHGEHQRIGPAMELAFALDEARRERAQSGDREGLLAVEDEAQVAVAEPQIAREGTKTPQFVQA